jgi:probable phosphoglycerate mutase
MNTIYLVRHGENPANLEKRLSCRRVDFHLTQKGRLQAEQAAAALSGRPIRAVYSSPLKRAVETAGIIAALLRLQAEVRENFREVDLGELEGLADPRGWRQYYGTLAAWLGGEETVRFPGGEDGRMVRARLRAGIESILEGREGQELVIVGHAGVFTAGLQALCPDENLTANLKMDFANCAIGELQMRRSGGRWTGRVVRWADVSHLSGEAARFTSISPRAVDPEQAR